MERKMKQIMISVAGLLLSATVFSTLAQAKSARCFTTDDGYYLCQFRVTDFAGSFEIRGRGKPAISLIVSGPGFADAYLRFGRGRSIPVNGQYVRSRDDGACWNNPEQNTKICVW
jgi:hypothetical protein